MNQNPQAEQQLTFSPIVSLTPPPPTSLIHKSLRVGKPLPSGDLTLASVRVLGRRATQAIAHHCHCCCAVLNHGKGGGRKHWALFWSSASGLTKQRMENHRARVLATYPVSPAAWAVPASSCKRAPCQSSMCVCPPCP